MQKAPQNSFVVPSLRGILLICAEHPFYLVFGMLSLLGGVSTNLLFPYLLGDSIDRFTLAKELSLPPSTVGFLIGLFAVQGVLFYIRTYCFGILGQKSSAALRLASYQHLLSLPVAFFEAQRTTELVARLHADSLLIRDAIGSRLSVLIRYSLQVAAGIVLMALLSPSMTLLLLGAVVVFVVLSIFLGRALKQISKRQQSLFAASDARAEEALTEIKVVKSFLAEGYELKQYSDLHTELIRVGGARVAVGALFQSFMPFLLNAGLVLFTMYCVDLLNASAITWGVVVQFILYGGIVATSLSFIASSYGSFVQAYGALERISEHFALLTEESSRPTKVPVLSLPNNSKVGLGVKLNSVSFGYPASGDRPILKTVSCLIEAGRMTALVGSSGAGKTSLAKLLLQFYNPSSGSISYDEIEGTQLSLASLRAAIAFVPQEPLLFSTTIENNLRLGHEEYSESDLWDALRRANAAHFIEQLPQKLHTKIGGDGIRISGGERQRIALARALLRSPRLLILDEATSALDSENETIIQDSLSKLLPATTILVIAHRLATAAHADQVIVLEGGQVSETGEHTALMERKGRYYEFVVQQQIPS